MFDPKAQYAAEAQWLAERVSSLTDTFQELRPSGWAEAVRYLTRATTPKPGPFSFDDTPYWREVVDCFDPNSDVQFVAVKKGAQVAATVGILENVIGFYIDYVRTSPVLFFTADAELAKLRVDTAIVPMIQASGLSHLIQNNDEMRANKRGMTDKKIEWAGGGYLLPLGAVNANKQRSLSAPILLRDEISGWPLTVGRDADPLQLTETRTNAYDLTRRVLDLSTPNIAATCAITKRHLLGDQRVYKVPCKHCGEMQTLRFRGRTDDGLFYGLRWETEDGMVAQGSVRYVCRFCSGEMVNEDKVRIMGAGAWHPTAKPSRPNFRSYHLSALYAPVFARTWESIAHAWVEAWDDEHNIAKDSEKLQVFYNNDLGEAYEVKADKIKHYQVSPHRRSEYRMGELPNNHAVTHTGGPLMLLTMTVDVQKDWLAVAVFAWSPSDDRAGYAAYLIDYLRLDGDTERDDAPVWGQLADIIDHKRYVAHDGREFPIAVTAVDAGFRTDTVYTFCSQWDSGVYPLRGRDKPVRGSRLREFDILESAIGTRYIAITVDLYKDRWSAALKRQWNGVDKMPRNFLSMPGDTPDKAVNELTVEYVREKRDPSSGKLLGTYWHRPGNARQELWDLLTYNTACLEVLAYDVCSNELGLDAMIWSEFWAAIEADGRYWTDPVDQR